MRRLSMMLAAALTIGASSASAQSQTPAGVPPAPGRFTVFLNGGIQAASQDVRRSTTFDLYEEQAQIEIVQNDIEGGGFVEIGGSYRFKELFGYSERLGAGLSYMFVSSSAGGAVNGSIPNPDVFDAFRPLTATADGLDHKEQVIHLFATWFMPMTEKLDVTFSVGPSFFNISQDFIRSVTFSETPPFDAVTVDSVELVNMKQNGIGFNIGADASYYVTRVSGFDVAVGASARYARGSADFDVTDNESVSVKGGGFQMAAGLRVRF